MIFGQYSTQLSSKPIVVREKFDSIQSIGIVPVDFDYYHLTAGGIREYSKKCSNISCSLICEQTKKIFSDNGYAVTFLEESALVQYNFKALRLFYNTVNGAIYQSLYSYDRLPGARSNFSYSIPSVKDLCNAQNVDALFFLVGFDDCSTGRRKKLKAGAVAGAVAGAIMAALIGVGGYTTIPPDYTALNGALVNKEGEIIWYHRVNKSGKINLIREEAVGTMVASLLKGFKKGTSTTEGNSGNGTKHNFH